MNEEMTYRATVCFLIKHGRINLPVKRLGIGTGFRNGYGGKIEGLETLAICAAREVLEEGRVKTWPQDLRRLALLRCHYRTETNEKSLWIVHVFETGFWLGEPKETKEMGPPEWFPVGTLPIDELMLDDRIWLPRVLKDRKPLVVTARYGPDQKTLEDEVGIEEVAVLPEE
ncbi:MAG: NUDIX hydrolase [Parcubacteria group bacterium GW2011_GWA2_47_16]|nr:MAG: NUDIX hydrolase [Parcubacteria group bacterium GW2011_GWA2_47_16]